MSAASLSRLLLLSAIWGGSFLFMRIGAPVLGPVMLIVFRVGLAALFLLAVALFLKKSMALKAHWKHYLVLGLFNSALPFLLFAYAAQTLSASLLSILNATAPIWGAIIGALWTRTLLSGKAVMGLLSGVVGVMLLVGFDRLSLLPGADIAIVAALGASFCYGITSVYTRSIPSIGPFANAHGSMWAATLIILPLVPFFPVNQAPSGGVVLSVVALGVLCSGIAYLLYFRLIADIGSTSALTVTFLVPLFGVLFGTLFLDEVVGWYTLVGAFLVIVGTALVTGFSPRVLFREKTNKAP
ncbi:DMT family transporter [Sedimenticola selenatireducens]|uniref:DMT family transporter n=1 Tax=Sedimenticola selenatireducens TaxID=191960 RepID=A0A557SKK1_9GAMM|nr:DMT family transporter [Sedimenticola selenatireducens]TVO77852.1 DMT family transporter [Sedimenticola selenatireducens]TVT65157.1 MAG: DMT family transporter [Sedimenticola selenatireducens]